MVHVFQACVVGVHDVVASSTTRSDPTTHLRRPSTTSTVAWWRVMTWRRSSRNRRSRAVCWTASTVKCRSGRRRCQQTSSHQRFAEKSQTVHIVRSFGFHVFCMCVEQVPEWKRNIVRFFLTLSIMGFSILCRDAYAYVGAFTGLWQLILIIQPKACFALESFVFIR